MPSRSPISTSFLNLQASSSKLTLPCKRSLYTSTQRSARKSHYESLSLSRNATKQQIKARFYELSKKHHPDAPGGSAEKFHDINDAYHVLGDDMKRKQYDNLSTTRPIKSTSTAYANQNYTRGTTASGNLWGRARPPPPPPGGFTYAPFGKRTPPNFGSSTSGSYGTPFDHVRDAFQEARKGNVNVSGDDTGGSGGLGRFLAVAGLVAVVAAFGGGLTASSAESGSVGSVPIKGNRNVPPRPPEWRKWLESDNDKMMRVHETIARIDKRILWMQKDDVSIQDALQAARRNWEDHKAIDTASWIAYMMSYGDRLYLQTTGKLVGPNQRRISIDGRRVLRKFELAQERRLRGHLAVLEQIWLENGSQQIELTDKQNSRIANMWREDWASERRLAIHFEKEILQKDESETRLAEDTYKGMIATLPTDELCEGAETFRRYASQNWLERRVILAQQPNETSVTEQLGRPLTKLDVFPEMRKDELLYQLMESELSRRGEAVPTGHIGANTVARVDERTTQPTR